MLHAAHIDDNENIYVDKRCRYQVDRYPRVLCANYLIFYTVTSWYWQYGVKS
jgi:hypothetical protein